MNAKTCSDRSAELYLAVLVRVSIGSFFSLNTMFNDPYHVYYMHYRVTINQSH